MSGRRVQRLAAGVACALLLRRKNPMESLRIFAGHSGWAPGQLEAEIGRGDWTLERAESQAVFKPEVERPWPARREPEVSI